MVNTENTDRGARKLPTRYGMIDQRIVNEGYLSRLSAEAVSLYVFLCVVANREGKSWYSDGRIVQAVRLSSLAGARRQLVDAGLVSWNPPVYSLLDVPERTAVTPAPPQVVQQPSTCERPASAEEINQITDTFRKRMGWG